MMENKVLELYGMNIDFYEERKEKLLKAYEYYFHEQPHAIFSSSGRIELLGNHTDHQHGKVLVATVDMDILAATNRSDDKKVTIYSENHEVIEIDLDDLEVKEDEKETSIALARGVLKGFVQAKLSIGGLHIRATSHLLEGVGVSSSAAFAMLLCVTLNYYYNDNKAEAYTLAKIATYAENAYFGKPSGLLDTLGIALGGINCIDFTRAEQPKIESLKWQLEGYTLFLVHTGRDHTNLTGYYAQIYEDMKKVAKRCGKEYLGEVDSKLLVKQLPKLYHEVGGRAVLRAFHFFDENRRVERGYSCILNNDVRGFIDTINHSGESSYKYLQNYYYSNDHEQGLALAFNLSRRILKNGACRVHGGGFAGTILAFVPTEGVKSFYEIFSAMYGNKNITRVIFRDSGATLVETLS